VSPSTRAPGALRLGDTPVMALWTGSSDGDQRRVVEGKKRPPLAVPAGAAIAAARQVHGADVVEIDGRQSTGLAGGALFEGDAVLATDETTCAVILVADCVPIAIGSPEGIRVAVHAGWRGLVAGVIQNSVAAASSEGATSLVAAIGPCIGPCCYEFSPSDLATVERAVGTSARAVTEQGALALDLRACALGILESVGVEVCFVDPACTSCSEGWYSARARSDMQRQAVYVWRAG
jgi:YfiH family protein